MKKDTRQAIRVQRAAALYNQLPNVIWSVINLVPISYFCYWAMPLQVLYALLLASLLTLFLPKSFFRYIQPGKTTDWYRAAGIRVVKKYTQDGDLINGFLRKKYPSYRLIDAASSIQKQIAKSYYQEKFHFSLFVFFLLTTGYALLYGYGWWSFVLLVTNVIYNVYPILLQQYNRLRMNKLRRRMR